MANVPLTDERAGREPHSLKLVLRSAAFGLLVAASVVVGQVVWRRILPDAPSGSVEVMVHSALSLATAVAALIAGALAYCEARWPKQAMAVVQASSQAARYVLLACVVGLILITAR